MSTKSFFSPTSSIRRWWVRSVRILLRAYPFTRGRIRLSGALLSGSLRGPYPGPSEAIVAAISEGEVAICSHGLKLRLHRDEAYVWPFLFGEYEEANTRLYTELLSRGDVVFDVGASYGWYTALFAACVGRSGRVHAFEPIPEFAQRAADTVALNDAQSVVQLNVAALGRKTGNLVIHTFAGLPLGHASASDLGRRDAAPHRCEVTTLDEYAAEQGIHRIDFLKVDVEGFERDVFLGGAALLTDARSPIVAFEVNLDCLEARGLTADDVQEPLRQYGYDHFWMIDPTRGAQSIGNPAGPSVRSTDYVAAKGQAAQIVKRAAALHRARG